MARKRAGNDQETENRLTDDTMLAGGMKTGGKQRRKSGVGRSGTETLMQLTPGGMLVERLEDEESTPVLTHESKEGLQLEGSDNDHLETGNDYSEEGLEGAEGENVLQDGYNVGSNLQPTFNKAGGRGEMEGDEEDVTNRIQPVLAEEGEGDEEDYRPDYDGEEPQPPPERRGAVQSRTGNALRHLPPPRVPHFRDDLKTPAAKCRRFFDYWRDVESLPWAAGRLMCYLYRIWPVMEPDHRQVDKLPDWMSMEDVLRNYGAGDYHLKLNDAGMNYKTLAICTIKNLGDRNLNDHPPVLDTDHVDADDPLNKSYISWARSRGIAFPGDAIWKANQEAKKQREDSMAESRITDRMLDMIERDRRKGQSDEIPSTALAKSMELISRAGEVQSAILEKGIDRVIEMTKPKDGGGSLRETLELFRTFMPQGGTSAEIQSVVNMILNQETRYTDKIFQIQSEQAKHQKEELDELRRQLGRLLEAKLNPASGEAAAAVKPKSLKEQLAELTEVKEVLKEALGIEDGGGGKGSWTDSLPLIIQAGTVLFQSAASMMYNYALVKTGAQPGQLGAGVPMQPPPMEAAMTEEQREAMAAVGMGGGGGMGAPNPQPHPHPQTTPSASQNNQENAMTRAHQFFATITVPLLRSFQEGESGADFAARLVDLTDAGYFGPEVRGTQVYDQVLEFGLPLVNSLIKTFPPIWGVVGQTPAKWERFIGEFFNARAIWTQQEMEEADKEDTTGPVPAAPPGPTVPTGGGGGSVPPTMPPAA